jgi:hypothetical protein
MLAAQTKIVLIRTGLSRVLVSLDTISPQELARISTSAQRRMCVIQTLFATTPMRHTPALATTDMKATVPLAQTSMNVPVLTTAIQTLVALTQMVRSRVLVMMDILATEHHVPM